MNDQPVSNTKISAGMLRLLDVATFVAALVAGSLFLDAVMLLMWR